MLILVLGVLAVWRMPDLSSLESLQTALPELQKISSLGNESVEENQYQEFISPDGKFKIEYPSHWLVLKEENLLQALAPPEWAEKYDLKTLFSAQNFWGGKFAQLIIYKGTFEISIEEIFEKMKENNEKRGWAVEVLKSDIKESEGIFEIKSQSTTTNTTIRSKEKILAVEKEAYLISLIALEKDWPDLVKKVDFIINSAQLLTKSLE